MDPLLVDNIVSEVKSQGVFDKFRKDSMSDVDTKPAYQNLRQRVETQVVKFLSAQKWRPDMNKNQLREKLRKHITTEAGFLDTGVERIVDQVVNPKISTIFQPKVEEIAYNYLGIERPRVNEDAELLQQPYSTNGLFGLNNKGLLPDELDAVSLDSDKNDESTHSSPNDTAESKNVLYEKDHAFDDQEDDSEEESPPFEPLEEAVSVQSDIDSKKPEESNHSQLSGISGLTSQDSVANGNNNNSDSHELAGKEIPAIEQESELSQVSSNSRLSIITNEDSMLQLHDDLNEPTNVNISEEAQMPKFSENSNSCSAIPKVCELHFDINQQKIEFKGTERNERADQPSSSTDGLFCKDDKTLKDSLPSSIDGCDPSTQNDEPVASRVEQITTQSILFSNKNSQCYPFFENKVESAFSQLKSVSPTILAVAAQTPPPPPPAPPLVHHSLPPAEKIITAPTPSPYQATSTNSAVDTDLTLENFDERKSTNTKRDLNVSDSKHKKHKRWNIDQDEDRKKKFSYFSKNKKRSTSTSYADRKAHTSAQENGKERESYIREKDNKSASSSDRKEKDFRERSCRESKDQDHKSRDSKDSKERHRLDRTTSEHKKSRKSKDRDREKGKSSKSSKNTDDHNLARLKTKRRKSTDSNDGDSTRDASSAKRDDKKLEASKSERSHSTTKENSFTYDGAEISSTCRPMDSHTKSGTKAVLVDNLLMGSNSAGHEWELVIGGTVKLENPFKNADKQPDSTKLDSTNRVNTHERCESEFFHGFSFEKHHSKEIDIVLSKLGEFIRNAERCEETTKMPLLLMNTDEDFVSIFREMSLCVESIEGESAENSSDDSAANDENKGNKSVISEYSDLVGKHVTGICPVKNGLRKRKLLETENIQKSSMNEPKINGFTASQDQNTRENDFDSCVFKNHSKETKEFFRIQHNPPDAKQVITKAPLHVEQTRNDAMRASQRYSNEDLYKPRLPAVGLRSKRRAIAPEND